jgi:hypothetical protein
MRFRKSPRDYTGRHHWLFGENTPREHSVTKATTPHGREKLIEFFRHRAQGRDTSNDKRRP